MARSLFNYYLDKASKGKKGFLEKLCRPLSERLIYVPFIEQKTLPLDSIVFTVPLIKWASMPTYPIFSSRHEFQRWAVCEDADFKAFSILAADFFLSVKRGSAVIVNVGGQTATFLNPSYVQYMAQAALRGQEQIVLSNPNELVAPEKKKVSSFEKLRERSLLHSQQGKELRTVQEQKKKYASAVAALNARQSLLAFFGLKAQAD